MSYGVRRGHGVEAGKVQLRHVMVGVIRADSAAKAAAIHRSCRSQAAPTQNEMNHGSGGIAPLAKISPGDEHQAHRQCRADEAATGYSAYAWPSSREDS